VGVWVWVLINVGVGVLGVRTHILQVVFGPSMWQEVSAWVCGCGCGCLLM